MTDEDKALVERLRVNVPLEAPRCLEAADRIEAQAAEIEKLRLHLDVALEVLAEEGVCGDECNTCKEARAALGETK